jgi:hypothetical protein
VTTNCTALSYRPVSTFKTHTHKLIAVDDLSNRKAPLGMYLN